MGGMAPVVLDGRGSTAGVARPQRKVDHGESVRWAGRHERADARVRGRPVSVPDAVLLGSDASAAVRGMTIGEAGLRAPVT